MNVQKKSLEFDPNLYRQDFPILNTIVHGKPLVYFDNAATTQKPRMVIEQIVDYYQGMNANVHRAIHYLGEKATVAFEEARKKVAKFINAPSARQIVFTRGTTEAINLVATAWGEKFIGQDDEIILTEMEHHSNLIPWQLLAQKVGAKLRFIPFTPNGALDFEAFEKILNNKTRLISLTYMSNVFGTINPIKRIVRMAKDRGIPVLLDGAQSVPHLPTDVQQLDCDFLAFSGHKMLGPTGIGVLYAKMHHWENMNPYQGGGEMIQSVWLDRATWNEIPYKFEAGTPNIAGAIALGAAIDYLSKIGMEKITLFEQELTTYALNKLADLKGIVIYGNAAERGGVISFNLGDVHPHDLSHFLDQQGIAVRAGHHCAQPIMRKLDIAATTRASFYFYNTFEEIDYFVEQLKEAIEFFTP
ncbi:MAG TPA: cysteine desulfurase [Caldithrix abyssi]|uniref:Cysteine desulfurase n=1 Tax=Caldithrix abyssi TaxID=187145 RepID=A0A7V5H4G7_CALAY|nr:cysteine desulfurase [Caldisericaceae bacterium]HHE55689.1 cysteine desulfurase [Caldithrix abyssi]